jgi:hypothetical protein
MGSNSGRPEGYEPNQMKRPLIRQANGNSERLQFLSADGRATLFFLLFENHQDKFRGKCIKTMHG